NRGPDARALSRHGGSGNRTARRDCDVALALDRRKRDSPRRPHRARRKYRACTDRFGASAGSVCGRGIPDGLPEGQRAVLEARGEWPPHKLGRSPPPRRRGRGALAQTLMAKVRMAKRVKSPAKRSRAASKLTEVKSDELVTLLDFVRFAASRFVEAKLTFAHGTTDPAAEAAFLVCETLYLHPDQFNAFANARVTAREAKSILDLIALRIASRKPAAYLVNKIYMRGLPFHVDERVIVPRSYIGELLDSHFGGRDGEPGALIEDAGAVENVLDLCTGSGCLAILASRTFANAKVDAVDVSREAIEVAARNVADYGLQDRVMLHRGDLFAPLGDKRYD